MCRSRLFYPLLCMEATSTTYAMALRTARSSVVRGRPQNRHKAGQVGIVEIECSSYGPCGPDQRSFKINSTFEKSLRSLPTDRGLCCRT